MTSVFSGDSKNLKSFSWTQTKEKAVNSKSDEERQHVQSAKRVNKDLEIETVFSKNEEEILKAMEKEKKAIEDSLKEEIAKEIENDNKKYQNFRVLSDELEQIKKDAYDKAYQEGLQKGQQIGETQGFQEGHQRAETEYQEKYELLQKNLLASLENIELFKDKILNTAKADTLELAMMIAKRIIRKEIQLKPEVLISILEDSIQHIVAKDKLSIFLSKEDYEIIKNQSFTLANAEKMVLTADSQLQQGEIRIESDLEQLSYSIDENVDTIGKDLKNKL